MHDLALFARKFLRHGTAIASVAPSSKWLSEATVRNVDWNGARTIVELGAGTGPVTKIVAERAHPNARVVVVERDTDFANLLRSRYGHVRNMQIVQGDVRDLDSLLIDLGIDAVDHMISGLPVPSFPRDLQQSLFRSMGRFLGQEGYCSQLTELPWVYQQFYRQFFHEVKFVFEPRNVPPAGAYYCRGVKELM